jgi:hypothetical protein
MIFTFDSTNDRTLDKNFGQIKESAVYWVQIVRELVDATNGAATRLLPDGSKNPSKDYFFGKTDASVNTVTITAFGSQTINGSTSYVLSSQYNFVTLAWDRASQSWFVTSFG